eukprot:RCo011269
MALKCVTLEVTGAIIALRTSVAAIYANALSRYGVPVPPEAALKAAYTKAFPRVEKQFPNWGNTALPDYKDWWRKAVAATFEDAGIALPEGAFPHIFQALYSEFGVPSSWLVHDDAVPFMKWAQQAGLLVGGNCVGYGRYQDGILPMLGVSPLLDFLIVSKDVGVQKPDPAAFKVALDEANKVAQVLGGRRAASGVAVKATGKLDWSEFLHIGDNVKKDFLPAKKLGMKALLLDRKGEHKPGEGIEAGDIIRSLAEVPELLEKRKWIK